MKPNKVKVSKLKLNPDNPRVIKGYKFEKLVQSIKEFPEMLKLRPIVVDENNNTYVFEDAILLGDMNSLDDYNKIEKGKKYKISGSGIRLTYLSLFPVIYEVKEI